MKKLNRLAIERLENREAPAADLAVQDVEILAAPDVAVPGDPVIFRFTVRNVGDMPSNPDGSIRTGVHFYLSDTGAWGDTDRFLGRIPNKTFRLAPGQGNRITTFIKMPDLSLPVPDLPEGKYYLLIEVDPPSKIDHDFGASTEQIDYRFQFGDVGSRKGVDLIANGGGGLVQFILPGGGTGTISAPGTGAVDLTLDNTTRKSTLQAVGAGAIGLRHVTANSILNAAIIPRVNVNGAMSFAGGLGKLFLASLGGPSDGASLNIANGHNLPATLIIGDVENANIMASKGINLLFLTSGWEDSGSADLLSAPYIKSLISNGDFEASVTLAGPGYNALGHVLTLAKIKGALRESIWTVNAGASSTVNKVVVGAAENWRLFTDGLVKEVRVNGNYRNPAMLGSNALDVGSLGSVYVRYVLATGPIVVHRPDAKDVSIAELAFGTVEALPGLNAGPGGIAAIKVKDWPARSNIQADWIDRILMTSAGFIQNPRFAPNLTLTGSQPKTNLGLQSFVGEAGVGFGLQRVGTLIGGSSGDPSIWNVSQNIGEIIGYDTEFWRLYAPTIRTLRMGNDISQSQISINSATSITAYGINNSTINAVGTIRTLEQKQGVAVNAFASSTIEASYINKLVLRDVDGASSPCFVKARGIDLYQRFEFHLPKVSQPLDAPGVYDPIGNFFIEILPS